MQEGKRFAFFIPNIFTALNMACGFAGILFAVKGSFYAACMLIFLGALFDTVDGRIARMTGTESSFGEQFDSLSDLISFGLAPSLIFYHRFLVGSERLGMVISFLFVLCGALRLARFNANTSKVRSDFFQGLPIPSAAIAAIGFVLFSIEFPFVSEIKYLPEAYLLSYSILMISNIPFWAFKNADWLKKHSKLVLLIIMILIVVCFIKEELMIVIGLTAYVLVSLIYYLFNRKKLKNMFKWEDSEGADE